MPIRGVMLYTTPPPPPKTLKLVIGLRSGWTLTNENPTGTSNFGTSCANVTSDAARTNSTHVIHFWFFTPNLLIARFCRVGRPQGPQPASGYMASRLFLGLVG